MVRPNKKFNPNAIVIPRPNGSLDVRMTIHIPRDVIQNVLSKYYKKRKSKK